MRRGRPPQRRAPLKAKSQLKAKKSMAKGRKPLPPESAKHLANRPTRNKVRAAVFLRDGGRCQAVKLEHDCGGRLDVHEIVPRDLWAAGYLVVDNCMLVCRTAHDIITDNRDGIAHELGYLKHSWERPEESQ